MLFEFSHKITYQPRRTRHPLYLLGLALLIVMLAILNIFVGSRDIPVSTAWEAFFHLDTTNSQHLLVHYLRLPRAILAIFIGLALGVSGALTQALTRNPLADPGILGVQAGATTGVVFAIAFLGMHQLSEYLWFGLIGAGVTGLVISFLANRGKAPQFDSIKLVLTGAALSILLLSMTHIVIINSEDTIFDQFRHWTIGSLQGRGWPILYPTAAGITIILCLCIPLSAKLNILSLGENMAKSMGVNIQFISFLISLAIISLSGLTTAAVGPIAFIGLSAPHIARMIVGPDYRLILPYSAMFAALLFIVADISGKVIGFPGEISAGIMSSLIGGPFFLYLIKRHRMMKL
ncbi:FecCD family ABC transporter permease [Vibrio viridaestus]|uniref:Iron ABC transporter permease n=1 Tax=Vibrio viridaestus TaxID=2487322 RepID=A0A3N9TE71_9VIBR|nr:iron ABC transporter permease [Vibrio viridaestus]RQW62399.1 iron ABC transporter permease [Vibrio viridaestus]